MVSLLLLYLLDKCPYGSNDNYTAKFQNSIQYPVDVFWIDSEQKKNVFYKTLEQVAQYSQITHFTHEWIFERSDTKNRVFARANGVIAETFEGCHFGAKVNSEILVEVISPGKL